MELKRTHLTELMGTNHPAKPYVLVGAVAIAVGVIRGRLSGLALVTFGGFAIAQAVKELSKTQRLHGGNFHGTSGPPEMEDRVALL